MFFVVEDCMLMHCVVLSFVGEVLSAVVILNGYPSAFYYMIINLTIRG